MNNSPLSMGWILAMFDLPVMTDKERKVATRFRNDLLENGFLMIQFSVYARPCVNFEQIDKHIGLIRKLVPEAGNVRLLYLTDQPRERVCRACLRGEDKTDGGRAPAVFALSALLLASLSSARPQGLARRLFSQSLPSKFINAQQISFQGRFRQS